MTVLNLIGLTQALRNARYELLRYLYVCMGYFLLLVFYHCNFLFLFFLAFFFLLPPSFGGALIFFSSENIAPELNNIRQNNIFRCGAVLILIYHLELPGKFVRHVVRMKIAFGMTAKPIRK